MNESLDLRNRILKMRESNNLVVSKTNSSNNNLMSKFENSIKDDSSQKSNPNKYNENDKNKEKLSKPLKNNFENINHPEDKFENKTFKGSVNNNEAQFLMLANKFNEAVEVILELSEKVEKLERNFDQNSHKPKKMKVNSHFFNFKMIIFLLIIPIIILSFIIFPFDFSLVKLIVTDILSNI